MASSPQTRSTSLDRLTPRQIVEELDRYVIGQRDAKRMVAIALRNRWRRQQLSAELRDEVIPKNIIMIGPTGVGKTEIARRLAKLAQAPFLKVEASKFTEVGYVGRDVESIIRDLTELAVGMVKSIHVEQVEQKAEQLGEERLLDLLLPPASQKPTVAGFEDTGSEASAPFGFESQEATRSKLRLQLREGKLDHRSVELEVKERGLPIGVISNVAQSGFLISSKAITPDLNRINPMNALNRFISLTILVELAKTTFKLGIVGWLLYRAYQEGFERFEPIAAQPTLAMSIQIGWPSNGTNSSRCR